MYLWSTHALSDSNIFGWFGKGRNNTLIEGSGALWPHCSCVMLCLVDSLWMTNHSMIVWIFHAMRGLTGSHHAMFYCIHFWLSKQKKRNILSHCLFPPKAPQSHFQFMSDRQTWTSQSAWLKEQPRRPLWTCSPNWVWLNQELESWKININRPKHWCSRGQYWKITRCFSCFRVSSSTKLRWKEPEKNNVYQKLPVTLFAPSLQRLFIGEPPSWSNIQTFAVSKRECMHACLSLRVCRHVCMYACMYVCMDGWMHACRHEWIYVYTSNNHGTKTHTNRWNHLG